MKLPFNVLLTPILKPTLGHTRLFCSLPTFSMSAHYALFYGVLGFLVNVCHFKKHLGEEAPNVICTKFMLIHDLKIIATSMGLVQYACLVVGCLTENPSLFLPHLFGQLIIVIVKIIIVLFLLVSVNIKSYKKLVLKIPAVMLLAFNWLQEFCAFRQYLCICDL